MISKARKMSLLYRVIIPMLSSLLTAAVIGIIVWLFVKYPKNVETSVEEELKHETSHKMLQKEFADFNKNLRKFANDINGVRSSLDEVSVRLARIEGPLRRDMILSSATQGFVHIATSEIKYIPSWFKGQDSEVAVLTEEMIDDLAKLNREFLSEIVRHNAMTTPYAVVDFGQIEAARALVGTHTPKALSYDGVFFEGAQPFTFTDNEVVQIKKLTAEIADEIATLGELEISKYRVIEMEQFQKFARPKNAWNPVLEDAVMSGGNVWITAYQADED